MNLSLGIDIGSSSTKAAALDMDAVYAAMGMEKR